MARTSPAFGSIGVELTGLFCKGCCTSVVTQLTQDGRAEGNKDVSRSGVIKVSGEAMAFLPTNAQVGTTTEVDHLIPQAIVTYDHISPMPAGHSMVTKRIKGSIRAVNVVSTAKAQGCQLGRRKHLTSGGERSVALPADFNKFTWKPSAGPSPVHIEVQCRAHLQFTWRPSAGPSPVHMEVQCRAHLCSHGGLVQGPFPVHMEAQCRAISCSHGGPSPVHMKAHAVGPSPQSGARHAAQLVGCQPGLHHQGTRSEGQGQHTSSSASRLDYSFMWDQHKQQGTEEVSHPAALQTLS
eukprot:Em0016g773a